MCLGIVYGYVDRNFLEGSVVWIELYVIDNNDKIIMIIKMGLVVLNRKIWVGIYQVIYNVVDLIGNKVVLCVINVVMKGKRKQVCYKKYVLKIVLLLICILFVVIKCLEIYLILFQFIICLLGIRYGSICNILCEEGLYLNGNDIVVCERRIEEQFGYWIWEDNWLFC